MMMSSRLGGVSSRRGTRQTMVKVRTGFVFSLLSSHRLPAILDAAVTMQRTLIQKYAYDRKSIVLLMLIGIPVSTSIPVW